MLMVVMDGRKIKQRILDELKEKVSKISDKPSFVVIQVGNDTASNTYILQKKKMALYIGYKFQHIKFSCDVTMDSLLKKITELNNDNSVHGIMVQMPLPSHLDSDIIQNAILPRKDIDGLCEASMGRLVCGRDALYSCTSSGVMRMLKEYDISVVGKHVVVVGRSNLVGKPMAMMLINAGATVTVCHSMTKDLKKYTKQADILIVAVGKPNFITSSMVKDEVVVISVGINFVNGKIVGDIEYDELCKKASYITPTPFGVGPLTVAMLGVNILKAYMNDR